MTRSQINVTLIREKNMRATYRMQPKLSKSKLNKLTYGNYFHELFEKTYEEYNDSRYNNIKHLLKKNIRNYTMV